MAEPNNSVTSIPPQGEDFSFLMLANILLAWRRTLVVLAVAGAVLGLVGGLLKVRMYEATATFLPQSSESGASGLALAASQLGVRVPGGNGSWGPPIYVQVLRSTSLLKKIADDTVVVTEENGRHVALAELLGFGALPEPRRSERTASRLGVMTAVGELGAINAVRITATTRWPSVSLAIVQRLLSEVNDFNIRTRKSQAAAERQFVENQTAAAEKELRQAENRQREFQQSNRSVGAPNLALEAQRLSRETGLRQQIYMGLMQSREDAKSREVRDTPVITVIDEPRLPLDEQPRKLGQRIIFGAFAGVAVGVLIAFLANALSLLAHAQSGAAREFRNSIDLIVPARYRRWEN